MQCLKEYWALSCTRINLLGAGGVREWGYRAFHTQNFALANAYRAGFNPGRKIALIAMIGMTIKIGYRFTLGDLGDSIRQIEYPDWEDMEGAAGKLGESIEGTVNVIGRAVGAGIGGATAGFTEADPATAKAIGSIAMTGTVSIAMVIGVMLVIAGYNAVN